MKEILIEIEDNEINNLIKKLSNLKIKSIDEVIDFNEAKRRVAEAIKEYKSGNMKTYKEEEFDKMMQNFWTKYEN